MKKSGLVFNLIVVSVLLCGCAGNVKNQSAQIPVVESGVKIEPALVPEPPVIIAPVAPPVIETPAVQAPTPAANANAVASLVKQARAQYESKKYQEAIATAERALRIDRRSPEVYLVLAQSYFQLANTQLAQQFLQQGIRYAQSGSAVADALLDLKYNLFK